MRSSVLTVFIVSVLLCSSAMPAQADGKFRRITIKSFIGSIHPTHPVDKDYRDLLQKGFDQIDATIKQKKTSTKKKDKQIAEMMGSCLTGLKNKLKNKQFALRSGGLLTRHTSSQGFGTFPSEQKITSVTIGGKQVKKTFDRIKKCDKDRIMLLDSKHALREGSGINKKNVGWGINGPGKGNNACIKELTGAWLALGMLHEWCHIKCDQALNTCAAPDNTKAAEAKKKAQDEKKCHGPALEISEGEWQGGTKEHYDCIKASLPAGLSSICKKLWCDWQATVCGWHKHWCEELKKL